MTPTRLHIGPTWQDICLEPIVALLANIALWVVIVSTNITGGNAGAYGAGGGSAFHLGTAGTGANGVIVVVFAPIKLHQLSLTGVGS